MVAFVIARWRARVALRRKRAARANDEPSVAAEAEAPPESAPATQGAEPMTGGSTCSAPPPLAESPDSAATAVSPLPGLPTPPGLVSAAPTPLDQRGQFGHLGREIGQDAVSTRTLEPG